VVEAGGDERAAVVDGGGGGASVVDGKGVLEVVDAISEGRSKNCPPSAVV